MVEAPDSGKLVGYWPVCESYVVRGLTRDYEEHELGLSRSEPLSLRVLPGHLLNAAERWRWYAPLQKTPNLFVQFANLVREEQSLHTALNWYRKYGLLGLEAGTHGTEAGDTQAYGEDVGSFFREVEQAADTLVLCDLIANGAENEAKERIREQFGNSFGSQGRTLFLGPGPHKGDCLVFLRSHVLDNISSKFSPSGLPAGRVRVGPGGPPWVLARQRFDTLLEAMYVQIYEVLVEGGKLVRCAYCDHPTLLAPILPGEKSGHSTKRFCSNRCRQRHHYYTKTKPKRQSLGQNLD